MKKYCAEAGLKFCPVETGIELLSGKWKGRILWKLYNEKRLRFGELRKALGNVTEKMLAAQLRELEKAGLVDRYVYTEVPPRVEYSLSEFGATLAPVLDQFALWGVENAAKMDQIFHQKAVNPS
jgi:DNA-binding HxlR family transcriptional regulator